MDNNQNRNPNGGANANRLHLNFGNNDRFSPNDRAYPTTPSTFPQPVFPQGGGQAQQGQNLQPQQYNAGYAPQPGYFMNNPYPPQYPPQSGVSQSQYQQASSQPPYSGRGTNPNDPTNGLAHQLSHQNLGGSGRASPYRQPSPSSRPRTAGAPSQQPGYSSYLNLPVPSLAPAQQLPEFQPVPERNPDKYGAKTQSNQKRCAQMAADFFKDSVKRARDRNVR